MLTVLSPRPQNLLRVKKMRERSTAPHRAGCPVRYDNVQLVIDPEQIGKSSDMKTTKAGVQQESRVSQTESQFSRNTLHL